MCMLVCAFTCLFCFSRDAVLICAKIYRFLGFMNFSLCIPNNVIISDINWGTKWFEQIGFGISDVLPTQKGSLNWWWVPFYFSHSKLEAMSSRQHHSTAAIDTSEHKVLHRWALSKDLNSDICFLFIPWCSQNLLLQYPTKYNNCSMLSLYRKKNNKSFVPYLEDLINFQTWEMDIHAYF